MSWEPFVIREARGRGLLKSRAPTTAYASKGHDMSSSGNIILRGALAARSLTVRRLLTAPSSRCLAKIGGIFFVGIIVVYVYSKYWQLSGRTDETLLDLVVFGAAAVSSIGGFAFSALCGAALFHTEMGHVEVVQTMLMSSIGIQFLMIIKIWQSIDWPRFCKFLIGGFMGIPFGLLILLHVERHLFAAGVGGLLSAYSAVLNSRRRPVVVSTRLAWLDPLVGFAGGITGGAVAFPGAPVTAWCQLKGWTRDQQRGVYQPYILAMQIASLGLMQLLGNDLGNHGIVLGHLASVPPALVGSLIGLYIYQQSTDRIFSIVINSTLFVSGLTLIF